jgi:DNA repair exonuclease SbcCD ATPase subunit
LVALLQETEANYGKVKSNYLSSKKTYEDTISELDKQILEKKGEISSKNTDKDTLEGFNRKSQQTIEDSNDAITAAEQARAESHEAYLQKVEDLTEAIQACTDALALLHELDDKDLTAPSFLQITEKKLRNHFMKVQEKLANMKLKNSITPLIKMLVEVAQQGVNSDMIQRIITLVEELRRSLEAELETAHSDERTAQQLHETTLKTLGATIEAEESAILENTEAISKIVSWLDENGKTLEALEASRLANDKALEKLNIEWEAAFKAFGDSMARLRKDIEVLNNALNWLATQEV